VRVIDRIFAYISHFHLSPHSFERSCDIANGYLKKQMKGKGTIGSEILIKIGSTFKDLNITWLITGRGRMINDDHYATASPPAMLSEDKTVYQVHENTIRGYVRK
jgi:hypothetical protein